MSRLRTNLFGLLLAAVPALSLSMPAIAKDDELYRVSISSASEAEVISSKESASDEEPSFGFTIRKLGDSGLLSGAVFRLYTNEDDASEDKDPMFFVTDGSETTYTRCYDTDCPSGGLAVNDIYAGRVNVRGLSPGYYYLAEAAAPKGYQKLPFIYEIKIDDNGMVFWRTMVSGTDMTQVAGGLLNIQNHAAVLLPGTGGAGSAWSEAELNSATLSYKRAEASLSEYDKALMLKEARAYNAQLFRAGSAGALAFPDEIPGYDRSLDLTGDGVMGRIVIPKIGVDLPIYHGTDAKTLSMGAGHMQGSSLPVGGESTHCVIAAHRGLPGAALFTDLDLLEEGDRFMLYASGDTLVYEVESTAVVPPTEIEELYIVEGEDRCTLITCTPYGINTHRLLIKGRRVEGGVQSGEGKSYNNGG